MKVYVAATRQNHGKTIVSLGLLKAFQKRKKTIGYMKPVGQQFRLIDDKMIDKDVVLMSEIFGLEDSLPFMSPIAIPHGFTEDYILKGKKEVLEKKILKGHEQVSKDKEFLLIEGTGQDGYWGIICLSFNHDPQLSTRIKPAIIELSRHFDLVGHGLV